MTVPFARCFLGTLVLSILSAAPTLGADRSSVEHGRQNHSQIATKITFTKSELETPSGIERIYHRIQGAARRLCESTEAPWDASRARHYAQCYYDAVDRAVCGFHNKYLNTLYQKDREVPQTKSGVESLAAR